MAKSLIVESPIEDVIGDDGGFAADVTAIRENSQGGARFLRRLREDAGLTQQQLAQRLGISQPRVSAMESGSGPEGPSYAMLSRVAQACGVEWSPETGLAGNRPKRVGRGDRGDRETAADTGEGRNTMLQIADRMGTLGTETAFEVLARANALAAQGRSIINLGIGQPDFPTPAHIVEAGRKALADGHHGYTPANGIPRLREAVAKDLYRRHRVEISPDRVLVVPGGKVTMFFAILMFGEPGAEILYPNPGFPIYESVIRFSGATPVPVPLYESKGFSFSADEVLDKITPRTRLLIINSPANPTGGVVPRGEFDRLVAGLERHPHVAVMSDEIYGEILYDGAEHVSLTTYPSLADRLILLDGWSKTYAMTGWRMGYGVWPKALFPHAERLAINCHSCVNAAAQFAGIAALEGPRAPVEHMVAAFAERRKYVIGALNSLPGVRCVQPGGAFYAFPNISDTGYSAQALQTALLDQAGVAMLAGTSFGAFGEDYVRISYANSLENIEAAIARMREFLGNLPRRDAR